MDLAQQKLAIANLEIEQKVAQNQKLPGLDFQVRYGWNGLGGDVRVLAPGQSPFDPNAEFVIIDGGYADALEQITDREFKGWQASLNFNYPLQNRSARARSADANLAVEQGRTQLDDLMLSVMTEVRQAARGVRTAAQQIDSARVSSRLALENLEAQRKRYENGLATSFEVLEIQEDLSQARSREVSAIAGYRRALVAYFQAMGTLLEENGVELEDDATRDNVQP